MSETIHLVGGGLVGALTAIHLAKRGHNVALYERRPDMRKSNIAAGRSINLAITARGLKSLREAGLYEEVMQLAIPIKGRMLHDLEGNTTFVPYGQKEHEVIYSVSRGDLNKLLLTNAERYPNIAMHFEMPCTGYDGTTLQFGDTRIPATHVIGTDGSGSVLRQSLKDRVKHFTQTQQTSDYGYKELAIAAGPDKSFRMEKHALHIWPRGDFMLMALPNLDGSFTLTFFCAHNGPISFEALDTPEKVQAFFEKHFADATEMMPDLTDSFFGNPTGQMVTVKCSPWHDADKLLLIGDAAHAIVPFYGQGANCGFEDASALADRLDGMTDWASLFAAVDAERKPNADAIADMALENFVEMRATVADPKFQLKKEVGFELERRYPGRFIPRYAMVVFHPEIPYAEARRRGTEQDKMLDVLCANTTRIDEIDWNLAETLLSA